MQGFQYVGIAVPGCLRARRMRWCCWLLMICLAGPGSRGLRLLWLQGHEVVRPCMVISVTPDTLPPRAVTVVISLAGARRDHVWHVACVFPQISSVQPAVYPTVHARVPVY